MKFDCGETWAEKKERLGKWHRRFAWLPVRLADHDCRWLETVERRGSPVYSSFDGFEWEWEYRSLNE